MSRVSKKKIKKCERCIIGECKDGLWEEGEDCPDEERFNYCPFCGRYVRDIKYEEEK